MATTDVNICNLALAELGETIITALADRPKDLAFSYAFMRDELLKKYPWNFATKRKRVTAAGTLDCSAITITIADADPDTITRSGGSFLTDGFLSGDNVAISGAGSNNVTYGVATAAALVLTLESSEEVTAEVLASDADLKLYAQPAYGYNFKYPTPSDCITVQMVNEIGVRNRATYWAVEGNYIVTNALDTTNQIPIKFTQQITDPTIFSDDFIECFVIRIQASLALVIKENDELNKKLLKHLDYKLKQIFRDDAREGNPDMRRQDTGWETAGR